MFVCLFVLSQNIIFQLLSKNNFALLQAGLIRKWTTDVMAMKKREIRNRLKSEVKEKQEEREGTLALKLIHMQRPFFMYLAGIILLSLAIFSEILVF